jgi:REP element-mobilizing transposase RayT/DNA-binding NarL/FixJ family response regulator
MADPLLVVTPSSAAGESIRFALQETGAYEIHVVNNKAAAIVKADETHCSLAILDLALGEDWVRDIGQSLRTIAPHMDLVVLCEDENPPALDTIRPWTLLRKPFHIKQLLQSIHDVGGEAGEQNVDTIIWLQDVAVAAQHLTRLTLESSAQAALITRRQELWAYAGGLSQSAAHEVARTVTRNWDEGRGGDLLRFIRLESTRAEHMLYATRLASDAVLALVFDAETPFSTIRMQANDLITAISTDQSAPLPEPAPAPAAPLIEESEEEDGIEIPPISGILKDIPAPNPPRLSSRVPREELGLPAAPAEYDSSTEVTRVSLPLSQARAFPRESSPSVSLRNLGPQGSGDPGREDDATVVSGSQKRPVTPLPQAAADEMAETRLSSTTQAERGIVLEPVSAGMYHLTYACLLVPRFSTHYLTGDLADQISEWLPTICVAFGWRLEYLAVRPEYLQWVVNVQPNTSPGYLMRVMRQQTSQKIFMEQPRLKKENPSGDFWAPGYLIMSGTQPHPPQLVRDYIRQARERQGIIRPQK